LNDWLRNLQVASLECHPSPKQTRLGTLRNCGQAASYHRPVRAMFHAERLWAWVIPLLRNRLAQSISKELCFAVHRSGSGPDHRSQSVGDWRSGSGYHGSLAGEYFGSCAGAALPARARRSSGRRSPGGSDRANRHGLVAGFIFHIQAPVAGALTSHYSKKRPDQRKFTP
jgi:hypothetical protein